MAYNFNYYNKIVPTVTVGTITIFLSNTSIIKSWYYFLFYKILIVYIYYLICVNYLVCLLLFFTQTLYVFFSKILFSILLNFNNESSSKDIISKSLKK